MRAPPTLVLDTNAWLDLLVFRDAAVDGLAAAVREGRLRIATDARAHHELERVLRYEVLALDAADAGAMAREARSLACVVEVPPLLLPRCRDPDDQMFLEIAAAARAALLLTRDAELLRLAPRMRREHGIRIARPAAWRDALAIDAGR